MIFSYCNMELKEYCINKEIKDFRRIERMSITTWLV